MLMRRTLVVDDEKPVRSTIAKMLTAIPAEVKEAGSGEEGLLLFLQEEFDLVVTDYLMPGMNGIEFIRECRQYFPEIPFILVSGIEPGNVEILDEVYFLKKPFKAEDLMSLVRYILGT